MTRAPLDRKTMKEEIDTHTQERLFVLSANDKFAAEQAMKNLGVYLEQRPEIFQNDLLSNLAYTLGQRKSMHSWRVAITASSAVVRFCLLNKSWRDYAWAGSSPGK
jgi:acyl transferase domain-containing protein